MTTVLEPPASFAADSRLDLPRTLLAAEARSNAAGDLVTKARDVARDYFNDGQSSYAPVIRDVFSSVLGVPLSIEHPNGCLCDTHRDRYHPDDCRCDNCDDHPEGCQCGCGMVHVERCRCDRCDQGHPGDCRCRYCLEDEEHVPGCACRDCDDQ